jgi:hypothetical protein
MVAACFGFTAQTFYTMIPCSINETFAYENFSLVDLTLHGRRSSLRG